MDAPDGRGTSSRRWFVLITAGVWIVFVCGLPLRTASEARRQAHLEIAQLLAGGKLDTPGIVAAFDRSTQDVIAAATIPCLALAVCMLLLIHQMLKLKRRYNALERDPRERQVFADPITDDLHE